VAGELK